MSINVVFPINIITYRMYYFQQVSSSVVEVAEIDWYVVVK